MSHIYVMIYAMPLWATVLLLGIGFCIWYMLVHWSLKANQNKWLWKLCCVAAFLVWGAIVLYYTVLSRTTGKLEVHWMPLYQLGSLLKDGPQEIIRTAWMNVLLFVPGGLFLHASLPRKWNSWQRVAAILLLLTSLSVGIEVMQYRYALGCVETDDVIFNVLGAGIGTLIDGCAVRLARKDQGQIFKSMRDCVRMLFADR